VRRLSDPLCEIRQSALNNLQQIGTAVHSACSEKLKNAKQVREGQQDQNNTVQASYDGSKRQEKDKKSWSIKAWVCWFAGTIYVSPTTKTLKNAASHSQQSYIQADVELDRILAQIQELRELFEKTKKQLENGKSILDLDQAFDSLHKGILSSDLVDSTPTEIPGELNKAREGLIQKGLTSLEGLFTRRKELEPICNAFESGLNTISDQIKDSSLSEEIKENFSSVFTTMRANVQDLKPLVNDGQNLNDEQKLALARRLFDLYSHCSSLLDIVRRRDSGIQWNCEIEKSLLRIQAQIKGLK
jgi:archaellum component FlaC